MTKATDAKAANKQMPEITWNDSKMRSSYANVCNVTSSREEMTLLFGTNQTWHTAQKELTVELNDRIVMSPFAAKRLLLLLNNVVTEYESRFGALSAEPAETAEPAE